MANTAEVKETEKRFEGYYNGKKVTEQGTMVKALEKLAKYVKGQTK